MESDRHSAEPRVIKVNSNRRKTTLHSQISIRIGLQMHPFSNPTFHVLLCVILSEISFFGICTDVIDDRRPIIGLPSQTAVQALGATIQKQSLGSSQSRRLHYRIAYNFPRNLRKSCFLQVSWRHLSRLAMFCNLQPKQTQVSHDKVRLTAKEN